MGTYPIIKGIKVVDLNSNSLKLSILLYMFGPNTGHIEESGGDSAKRGCGWWAIEGLP